MPDLITTETPNPQAPPAGPPAAGSPPLADPPKGDPGAPEHMIPKSRLDAEAAKRREAETELGTLRKEKADRETAERAADEQKKKAAGQLQELLDAKAADLAKAAGALEKLKGEHKQQGTLVEELTAHVNALIDTDVAKWSEDVKAGDPGPENLSARMGWAARVREVRAKETTPSAQTPPAAGNGTGGKPPVAGSSDAVRLVAEAESEIREQTRRAF